MPGISFNMPYQSPQQGPTCWYYAMKHVLKFHAALDPLAPLAGPWKQLHRARQVMTSLRAVGVDETPATVSVGLFGSLQALSGPDRRTAVGQQIRGAIAVMGHVNSTDRLELLRAFLGNGFVRTVTIDPWTPDGLHAALTDAGPFYISVDSAPRGCGSPISDPIDRSKDVLPLYKKHFVGGYHAMVITGVHTASGWVYLRNPNDPVTTYVVKWDVLNGHLQTPAGLNAAEVGIAYACGGGGAACAHTLGNARRN